MNDAKSNLAGREATNFKMPAAPQVEAIVSEVAETMAERIAAFDDGRNPIFDILVRDETDLEGLVAYALYKQNKRDWLIAFEKSHGRQPVAREIASYILGERTARRIETYRRLAADALLHHAGPPRPAPARAAIEPDRPSEPLAAPRKLEAGPIAPPRLSLGREPPAEEPSGIGGVIKTVLVLVVLGVLAYFGWRYSGAILGR
jgi:hypothetical protein